MRRKFVVLCCTLLIAAGCSKDDEEMPVETYFGDFTTVRYSLGETRTDSVIFTYDNRAYAFKHLDNSTGLCNSSGEAINFGTNQVTFTPNSVTFNMTCDTLRVPRGEFDAFFRSGPGYDSLILLKNDSLANDIKYDIRLIRTQ